MSVLDLMTRPMQIDHIADSTGDGYGNATKAITSTDNVLGYIEPISETLHLVEANTFVTTHQVVLPPEIVLTAEDRVTVDGKVYRCIESLVVTNARTGVPHHVEGRVLEQTG